MFGLSFRTAITLLSVGIPVFTNALPIAAINDRIWARTATLKGRQDSAVDGETPAGNGTTVTPEGTNSTETTVPDQEADATGGAQSGPFVMAYYPDWVQVKPQEVDFSLLDWIDIAFALPTSAFDVGWGEGGTLKEPLPVFKEIVDAAHAGKTKVKISVGGWTGSKHFSAAVATAESRSKFIESLVSLYKSTKVDGLDLDWEYPGQEGDPGNKYSLDDTDNYLIFMKALRKALGPEAKLTAAVTPIPWIGKDGNPSKDLKGFAEVMDWVLIMNYDVNVPVQQFPGPNAPLVDNCGNAERPLHNAYGGLKAWKEAGFPANKIALGIAGYGYIHKSDAKEIKMRSAKRQEPAAESTASGGAVKPDAGGTTQIQFSSLIKQGALSSDFKGAGGFTRNWDTCSGTPFLTGAGQLISYDDPRSIYLKGKFASQRGMLGLGMWDIHGDTKDFALLKAAKEGLSFASAGAKT